MWSLGETARCLAVTFGKNGLISSLSPGAEQVIGFSARDLVGEPITRILADRSVFEVASMMEQATERGLWEGKIVHLNQSGISFEAAGNVSMLLTHEGPKIGFLMVSTLVRNADGDPYEQVAVKEVALKLRTFAHELNNPLAVMMGFTQLILLNAQCTGKVRADVDKLFSELKRVIQVVERLHGYALSLQETERSEVFVRSAGA